MIACAWVTFAWSVFGVGIGILIAAAIGGALR